MNFETINDYKRVLLEIKTRVEAIDQVINRKFPEMRTRIGVELCYLQLRMICELIAIGSLILHKDAVGERRDRLETTYNADKIVKELAKLHPKFFLQPIQPNQLNDGPLISVDKPSLTLEEFIALYNRVAGSELHRGVTKGIMERNLSADLNAIGEIRNKLFYLLNHHIVISADESHMVYCAMEDGNGGIMGLLLDRY